MRGWQALRGESPSEPLNRLAIYPTRVPVFYRDSAAIAGKGYIQRVHHTMTNRSVAVVAPSLKSPGGQGVQAAILTEELRHDGWDVTFVAVNPDFPAGLRWLRRYRYLRTLANELVYLASLLRLRHGRVAHVFSASYWSFLLAPLPAVVAARLFGKRVVLNYHSGEAEDHLGNWGILVRP